MGCENVLPGICYQFPIVKGYLESSNHGANPANGRDLFCLGCMLTMYLDTEKDHFKEDKRRVLDMWLTEGVDAHGQSIYNRNDLNKLTDDFIAKRMIEVVRLLDQSRLERTNHLWFDREFDERQVPVTAQVARSLRGDFLQAPQIGAWARQLVEMKEREINPEKAKWQSKPRTSYLLGVRTHG